MSVETITSVKNPLVASLRALKTAKARRETGLFLVEGETMLNEALSSLLVPRALLAEAETPLAARFPEARLVTRGVLEAVCDTKTPQGMCAAFELPPPRALSDAPRTLVALDGVQDPGNVGTILRTADAFDCDGVFLVNACADPYSPKTARATMGAVFRRDVYQCTADELCALLQKCGLPLYGTALRNDTVSLRDAELSRAAVAIGSEGRGLSAELLSKCEKTIKIPMSPRCESLNAAVAASVVLWEMYR